MSQCYCQRRTGRVYQSERDFREFYLTRRESVSKNKKGSGDSPIMEKTFTIKKKYVFPESMEPLLMRNAKCEIKTLNAK